MTTSSFGHGSKAKSYPQLNEFTYPPKWDPIGLDNHSHLNPTTSSSTPAYRCPPIFGIYIGCPEATSVWVPNGFARKHRSLQASQTNPKKGETLLPQGAKLIAAGWNRTDQFATWRTFAFEFEALLIDSSGKCPKTPPPLVG